MCVTVASLCYKTERNMYLIHEITRMDFPADLFLCCETTRKDGFEI